MSNLRGNFAVQQDGKFTRLPILDFLNITVTT